MARRNMKLLRTFIEVDNDGVLPKPGTRVKTIKEFAPDATRGMFVNPKNLATRRINTNCRNCNW